MQRGRGPPGANGAPVEMSWMHKRLARLKMRMVHDLQFSVFRNFHWKRTHMRNTNRFGAIALLSVAAGAAFFTRPAQAQAYGLGTYGNAEWDTHDAQFYFVGATVGRGGIGWSPLASIGAYHLVYPVSKTVAGNLVEDGTKSLSAVTPAAGLRYGMPTGAVNFQIGYSFVSGTDVMNAPAVGAEASGRSGATGSFGADYWGTGSGPSTQFLANYNFGSQYAWTRGRAFTPLGSSSTKLGIEGIAQGGGKTGQTSHAFAVGGVLQQKFSPTFTGGVAAGAKWANSSGSASRGGNPFPYVKLEFNFTP